MTDQQPPVADHIYTVGPGSGIVKAADFTPQSYLLQIEETICSHCQAVSVTSRVFMIKTHVSLTAKTAARIRVPVEEMRQTLPIGTSTLTRKSTPFCHLCYTTVPQSVPQSPISEAAWAAALQKSAQESNDTAISAAMRKARETSASRKRPAIDIFSLMKD